MSVNGEFYCDGCFLYIGKQKHTAFKKPGRQGEIPEDYVHYHNRGRDDCWSKYNRTLETESEHVHVLPRAA